MGMRQILKKIKKETAMEIAKMRRIHLAKLYRRNNESTHGNEFLLYIGENTRAGKFEEWQHPRHFRLNFPTSCLKPRLRSPLGRKTRLQLENLGGTIKRDGKERRVLLECIYDVQMS